jgi:catechol 2,3-dioxygenase-like lactoylglutathione lyase family enzyme
VSQGKAATARWTAACDPAAPVDIGVRPLDHAVCMRRLARITLVVRDYDEAIEYYRSVLGFALLEDRPIPSENKRWVVMAPEEDSLVSFVLGRASTPEQESRIGNQTGGRVFLFLETDDFERDYRTLIDRGVDFVRPPQRFGYGQVAVFEDLYGNLWDLVEPTERREPGRKSPG